MATLREMKAEYDGLQQQMKAIIVNADVEKREMTPEETVKWDTMDADADRLQASIERREKLEAREKDVHATTGNQITQVTTRSTQTTEERKKAEERAFDTFVRFGFEGMNPEQRAIMSQRRKIYSGSDLPDEIRAQSTTTTAGGYTVPQGFSEELQKYLKLYGGVRPVARAFPTPAGNDIPWPTVDDTANKGELLGENSPANAQDVAFDRVILKAFKFSSKIVLVSMELLQDSFFDINAILRDLFVDRLGRITNDYFTTGAGTTEPQGVVTGASQGVLSTSTTAITFENLVDLEHSIDPLYRPTARWMCNDTTLKALKKLVDSNGRPLWQGYAMSGFGTDIAQPSILGYPYQINQSMADLGRSGSPLAGNKSLLFGDFNRFIVRDVLDMQLLRLTERYAEYGQVGFLAFARSDSRYINTAAVKYFISAAS